MVARCCVLFAVLLGCQGRPFDLSACVETLSRLTLDDRWFSALEELRRHGDASKEAKEALVRFSVAGAAGAVVTGGDVAARLFGRAEDPRAVAGFLEGVAKLDPSTTDVVQSLAAAWASEGDMVPGLAAADGDSPVGAAARVLLAARVLDAAVAGARASEAGRSDAVYSVLPNIPIPGQPEYPGPPVFSSTLLLLSRLLRGGVTAEPGLAPYLNALRTRADTTLGRVPYPQPIYLVPMPMTGPADAGLECRACPVSVLTVRREGYGVGARPVLAWSGGNVLNLAGDVGWPGPVVSAGGLGVEQGALALSSALNRARDVAAPIEAKLFPGGPRAMLVAVDCEAPASLVREALLAVTRAGVTSLALLPPGRIGVAVPVVVGTPPEAFTSGEKKVEVRLQTDKALVAVGGAQGVAIRWAPERGYKGKLKEAISQARQDPSVGSLVLVSFDDPRVSGWMLLDTASEVVLSAGEPLKDLEAHWPGMACTGRCPAALLWIPDGR